MLGLTVAYILTTAICGAAAGNGTISIHMTGEENISNVKTVIRDGVTFVSIDDISERLGIVSKNIDEGVIGLCKDDICILVELGSEENVLRDSGQLLVNADLVANTLGSKAEWIVSGKTLRFAPLDQVELDTVMKVGDVIPDFALPSITDGKMVSLNSFRGKRVLLFMWASW